MKRGIYRLSAKLAGRRDLPATAKIIIAMLAWRIGHKRHEWVGIREIAERVGVRFGAALDNIIRLEDAGLLEVQRGKGGKANLYSLPNDSVPENGTPASQKLEQRVPETGTEA